MQWYHVPEEHRIDLPGGQWMTVKKHLTHGEEDEIMAHMLKRMIAGKDAEIDPRQVRNAQCVVYLIDWSITDAAGKPVVIRDQPYDVVAAALNNMHSAGFAVIREAIEAHVAAMAAELDYEKNAAGASAPSPTSASAA